MGHQWWGHQVVSANNEGATAIVREHELKLAAVRKVVEHKDATGDELLVAVAQRLVRLTTPARMVVITMVVVTAIP